MSMTSEMKGPRLEFVVRKLPGTVERSTVAFDDETSQNIRGIEIISAGYMVFTPMGTCQRLTSQQLSTFGYNREPNIISRDKAISNKTAAGRFVNALTDAARKEAYKDMEDEVIAACIGKGNSITNVIDKYNAKGKVNVTNAA